MKHLKWGIMATGAIAGSFARGLNSTDKATALAVGSRTKDKAEAFAKEHEIERAYGSYDEMLADPDVDAVYIALPNHMHGEWSIKCAEAGKHILCEKPVTINAAELEGVLAAVKKHDVFFMEAFMYRCHPQWEKVCEIIKAGQIGDVRMLESSFAFNMGLDLNNIRCSNPAAGGGLMDVGCYCVSFSRLIAQEEPVKCQAAGHIGPESRVDEYAAGVLKFPSGIVAYFSCGTQCGVPTGAFIYGSKGSIQITNPWTPGQDGASLIVNTGRDIETIVVPMKEELYANEALTVAVCVNERQSPAMCWDDSRGQMRTLDALRKDIGLVFDCEKG